MRILHLTGELPYIPGASGGSTRQFQLLRALADRGHEIAVVSPVFRFQQDEVDLARLYDESRLRLVAAPRPRARRDQLTAALRRQPSLAGSIPFLPYYGLQARILWTLMAPEVARELSANPPDIVTVEHDINAAWVGMLPSNRRFPVLLTLHNFSPDYYRSRADDSRGLRRLAYLAEERRMTRYVRRHLPAFDHLVAVSERDAGLARRAFAGPITVVPNGAEVPDDSLPESDQAATVLYTGTMSHPPNRDGAIWLVEEVWPVLRGLVPNATLRIVGRNPTRDVVSLASRRDGIEVIGGVPTLAPYYADARVVVAPIMSGGGTRLKVLDALAVGRPVVATTVAVEGLSISEGEGVLIRDRAAQFAGAISELLDSSTKRASLAERGRAVVSQRFGWPRLAETLEAALESAIDQSLPTGSRAPLRSCPSAVE